jgi:Icc-related predicted phosphoesterase
MRLVVISDTHNKHKQVNVPEGDVLIHCGDFSGQGHSREIEQFHKWFLAQPHAYKVYIAGNHDIKFQDQAYRDNILSKFKAPNVHYLQDGGVTIEGVTFYGSPWQPEFHNWVFNLPRGGLELQRIWSLIPLDTDVLITHSPPQGVLDKCTHSEPMYPQHAGCELLRERILQVQPKYHLFGHVHEGFGMNPYALEPTVCVNTSVCNLQYQVKNLPVIIEI